MGGPCTTAGLASFNSLDGFMQEHDWNDTRHAHCHRRSFEKLLYAREACTDKL